MISDREAKIAALAAINAVATVLRRASDAGQDFSARGSRTAALALAAFIGSAKASIDADEIMKIVVASADEYERDLEKPAVLQ